jgi:hypothetical protein
MKEMVDSLSRNLALGVSRRKALWMFLAGSGVFGAFARQKASAASASLCHDSCRQQAVDFYELCINAAENCPYYYCPEFTLLPIKVNGTNITVNSTHLGVNGTYVYTFDETCTPVR